jgi:hypothetical protein
MTAQERVASIMRFGYTERQARFLEQVAVHGGYFLSRHFTAFIERRHGPVTIDFLRLLLNRNHVNASRVAGRSQIYHLSAHAFYAAIGHEHHNSRAHEMRTIRRRLIGLDFVQSRRDWTFLATECDRIAFFVDEHHVPRDVLPQAPQTIPGHPRTSITSFFPQRDPIAVAPDRSVIAFAYRDDGDVTDERFVTFMRRYAPLCERLPMPVEFVFVTAVDGQLDLAEHAFANTFGASTQTAGQCPRESEVLAYVQARHRVEQGTVAGLHQHELDALRIDLHRFPGAAGDEWYRRWQEAGDLAMREALNARPVLELPTRTRLLVHRVPFDYRLLGLWRGGRC